MSETKIIRNIAISHNLTGNEYKIFFLLLGHEYTRAMVCEKFKMSRNTVNSVTKKLLDKGLIKESRIEGRNIFLTACISGSLGGEKNG